MAVIKRQSPVRFSARPRQTEVRGHWPVILEYEHEGSGPWLVDLSHKTRWDLQDRHIGDQAVCDDLAVPESPGRCTLSGTTLVSRMNNTQATIYHLGASTPVPPPFSGYTDVGEATLFSALFGPRAFSIAEKLTNLDLVDPAKAPPFLLQGPFCRIPCQIIIMEKTSADRSGFLLTCSRGYGDSLVDAIQRAGLEFGLQPAGENRFKAWMEQLQGKQWLL